MAEQLPWMSNVTEFSNATYDEMFSAEAGYPQRAPAPEINSIEGIYAKQLEQAMAELNTSYHQAAEQAGAEPQRQFVLLKKQAAIDWETINKDRKTDAASKETKFAALDARYQKQVAAIESKQAPNQDALQQLYEQQKRELDVKFKAIADSDAQLVRLGQEGKIDPAEVEAERWSKALDREIPASAFRGKVNSLEQQQDNLRQDISDIEKQIKYIDQFRFEVPWGRDRWQRYNTTTDKWVNTDMPPEEGKAILAAKGSLRDLLRTRRKSLTDVIVRGDPTLQKVVQGRAAWDAANKHLNRNGTQGGGLVDLAASKPKPKLPRRQANQATGQTRISHDGGRTWQIE